MKNSGKFQDLRMKHSRVQLPKSQKLEGFGPPLSIKPAIENEEMLPQERVNLRIDEVYF